MLPIDGQTAKTFGLKFFGDTHVAGGCFRLKKSKKNFKFFFHGQLRAL